MSSTIRLVTFNIEGVNSAQAFKRREMEDYADQERAGIVLLEEPNTPTQEKKGGRKG